MTMPVREKMRTKIISARSSRARSSANEGFMHLGPLKTMCIVSVLVPENWFLCFQVCYRKTVLKVPVSVSEIRMSEKGG